MGGWNGFLFGPVQEADPCGHRLSMAHQMEKVAHASVLITPCGGVSMIIPFLPDGAHAIVMDYLSDGRSESRYGPGGCSKEAARLWLSWQGMAKLCV